MGLFGAHIGAEAIGVVFGGFITIALALWVEYLRSPNLRITLDEDAPLDFVGVQGSPAQQWRAVRVRLLNKSLGIWWARVLTRLPALECRATITFHHLNGQNLFGGVMEGRWSSSPEPVAFPGTGIIEHRDGNTDNIAIQFVDWSRLAQPSRISIYPGESQSLDVAVRLDDDVPCYGWNNETYRHANWRNDAWRLDYGRYLLKVTVASSGQRCTGYFQLLNDVPRQHFRLEPATDEQVRIMKTNNEHMAEDRVQSYWRYLNPIVVFTGFLVVVGFLQLGTMYLTNKTLQAEQRAWLAPQPLEVPDNFKAGIAAATRIKIRIANVGKEPAIKTNQALFATLLPIADFRNQIAVERLILRHMDGRTCQVLPLNPNGRAIFPGTPAGSEVDLSKEETVLALTDPKMRADMAMVAGCLTYETLGQKHYSEVCAVLEPVGDDWRPIKCITHNGAD